MEKTLEIVDTPVNSISTELIAELAEMQLALVGGGIGETVL